MGRLFASIPKLKELSAKVGRQLCPVSPGLQKWLFRPNGRRQDYSEARSPGSEAESLPSPVGAINTPVINSCRWARLCADFHFEASNGSCLGIIVRSAVQYEYVAAMVKF
jgi:hypothetical protein